MCPEIYFGIMTSVDGFITSCKDKYMSTGCVSSPSLQTVYYPDISQPFLVVVMFCCNRFIVAQLAVIKLCNKVIPQVATLIQHHLSFLKSHDAFYLRRSTISHQNNNTPLKSDKLNHSSSTSHTVFELMS